MRWNRLSVPDPLHAVAEFIVERVKPKMFLANQPSVASEACAVGADRAKQTKPLKSAFSFAVPPSEVAHGMPVPIEHVF
jgi:hypothetical protein